MKKVLVIAVAISGAVLLLLSRPERVEVVSQIPAISAESEKSVNRGVTVTPVSGEVTVLTSPVTTTLDQIMAGAPKWVQDQVREEGFPPIPLKNGDSRRVILFRNGTDSRIVHAKSVELSTNGDMSVVYMERGNPVVLPYNTSVRVSAIIPSENGGAK